MLSRSTALFFLQLCQEFNSEVGYSLCFDLLINYFCFDQNKVSTMLLLILLHNFYSSSDTTTVILGLESLMLESILSLQKSKRTFNCHMKKVAFVNCIFCLRQETMLHSGLVWLRSNSANLGLRKVNRKSLGFFK